MVRDSTATVWIELRLRRDLLRRVEADPLRRASVNCGLCRVRGVAERAALLDDRRDRANAPPGSPSAAGVEAGPDPDRDAGDARARR